MKMYFCELFFGGFVENLTRFERTRLLSARVLQLSLGAPALIKVSKGTPQDEIARKEFEKKVLPLAVLRHYPDGSIKRIDFT